MADSILFVRSGMEIQQNFRQRLHRQVHWERANRYEDGRYFIPVTLRLTTDSDSLFSGTSAIFPHRVTLMIEESDQGFSYTMLTFLLSDGNAGKFTGTLLHEDYFLGHTMFSDYVDNQPVRRTGIQTVQSPEDLKMSQMQGSGGSGCDWVYIHTICVGGDGGTNPEDCWDHYEWICEGSPPDMPDEEVDPGDDTGSGDGPGDGGSGPGEDPTPNIDCNGVPNGTAYMTPCGCIGGNTGITSCIDPCDIIFKYKSHTEFKNLMQSVLTNLPGQNFEAGYYKKSGDPNPTYLTGPANQHVWGIPSVETLTGQYEYLIHTHYDPVASFSTFSFSDILYVAGMAHFERIADPNEFVFAIITSQGGKYGLVVEDPQKAATFYQDNEATPGILGFMYESSYVKLSNTLVQNEQQLVRFLGQTNTGLRLIKATDNVFANWKVLEKLQDNTITEYDCN